LLLPCRLEAAPLPPPLLLFLQEFTNYFFLQRAATSTADGGTDWRLHAQVGAMLH
jgi:hypothetical protein